MDTPEVLHQPLSRVDRSNAKSRRGLILLTACCGVFAGFGSSFVFTFGVFLKPLSEAFGWTRAQVSLGFTAAALTVAVCSPFLGRLLDRYPARRIILPCVALYGIGFASLSLMTAHLFHFVAVLILLGVVGNGTTQLGYARVVSAWFDQSRGRALAIVMAGSGTGSMVFPPLAQALISAYGWRFAYGILGGLVLVLGMPLTAAFLYEPPESASAVAEPNLPRAETGVWRSVRSMPFVFMTSGLVLFSVATNGLNAHLPPLLTDRGLSPEHAATVLSVLGLASLTSRLTTGYLLDRFFAARAVAALFAVCAAGFLLILYSEGTAMAVAGSLLVGFGLGAESDAIPYLLTRYFGLRRFSELYAYTWSAYACAGALGPLLMGGMFDRTGSYESTLLVFCGLVIVSAGLFSALPHYGNSDRTAAPV